MKMRLWLGLSIAVGALGSAAVEAQCTDCTQVGGLILADTTWDSANSPYCVTQSVLVGNGATLTIEPGVVVCVGAGLGVTVGSASFGAATLAARGTATDGIIFLGNATQPPAGFWGGISCTNDAVDATYDPNGVYVSGSILEYVEVRDAGAASTAAIGADQSSPYITHCRVQHSTFRGISVNGTGTAPLRIEGCEVWDISSIDNGAVVIGGGASHLLTGNNVHNCAGCGIYINAQCRLENSTIHANTARGVRVESSADGSFIVGNTISSNALSNARGAGLYVNDADNSHITGNNIANNTASGSSASGAGLCLYNSTGCEVSGNTISGNTIASGRAGGADLYNSGGCTVANNIIVDNTAQNGDGGGVYLNNSDNSTLSGNVITGNSALGSHWGGGVCFYNSTNCALTESNISANTGQAGDGGISVNNSGNCYMAGNTIMENVTPVAYAAGVGFWSSGGSTMRDCFVALNHATAPNGTAIYVSGGDGADIVLAGDPNAGLYNTIGCNEATYCIYNDVPFNANGSNDVDARYVRWCTEDAAALQACIYDYFDNSAKSFVLWFPVAEHIPGDLNCDGAVTFDDINPFVQALAGYDGYHAEYPHCNWLLADCDNNCQVDFDDINPFVDLLSGG